MSVAMLVPLPTIVKLPYTAGMSEIIVRAILEGRYGNTCPQDYVEIAVESIKEEQIQSREARSVSVCLCWTVLWESQAALLVVLEVDPGAVLTTGRTEVLIHGPGIRHVHI